jgi:hypothetical protein
VTRDIDERRTKMRKRSALLFVLAGVFAGTTATAFADAPPPVSPHQHYLILPDGTRLPVGPDICDNSDLAQGFYGFHQNVHKGTPATFAFTQENNPVGFTITGCPV